MVHDTATKTNVLAQSIIRTELLAIKILFSGLFLWLIPLSLSYNETTSIAGINPIFTLIVMYFGFSSIHTLIYINKLMQKSLLAKAITSFMKVTIDKYC